MYRAVCAIAPHRRAADTCLPFITCGGPGAEGNPIILCGGARPTLPPGLWCVDLAWINVLLKKAMICNLENAIDSF